MRVTFSGIIISLHTTDCGQEYKVENGYVNFTGATTFGQSVPVYCRVGYEQLGDSVIHCKSDGTWSRNTICRIRGVYIFIC